MFQSTTTNKEYYGNGQLKHVETVAILEPMFINNYPATSIVVSPEGSQWIRVGLCAKYHDNGQIAWQKNYDDFGRVDKSKSQPSYRKDGTIIVY